MSSSSDYRWDSLDPDRIFFNKEGKVFFIEFKSAKGKLSKLQEKKISELITYKQDVFVVNSEELGIEILTRFMIDVVKENWYKWFRIKGYPEFEPK